MTQEVQVHAVPVMNATDQQHLPTPGNRRAIAQHVFELIPTVPLFLPEELPSNAPYYPISGSPPQASFAWVEDVGLEVVMGAPLFSSLSSLIMAAGWVFF